MKLFDAVSEAPPRAVKAAEAVVWPVPPFVIAIVPICDVEIVPLMSPKLGCEDDNTPAEVIALIHCDVGDVYAWMPVPVAPVLPVAPLLPVGP